MYLGGQGNEQKKYCVNVTRYVGHFDTVGCFDTFLLSSVQSSTCVVSPNSLYYNNLSYFAAFGTDPAYI